MAEWGRKDLFRINIIVTLLGAGFIIFFLAGAVFFDKSLTSSDIGSLPAWIYIVGFLIIIIISWWRYFNQKKIDTLTPKGKYIKSPVSDSFSKVHGAYTKLRVVGMYVLSPVLIILGILSIFLWNQLLVGIIVIIFGIVLFIGARQYWKRSEVLSKGRYYAKDR